MLNVLKKSLLILAVAMGLMGCGEDQQMVEGGIGGTGISSGPISGFGSIIVNGVHFDVSQAQIWVDGNQSTESALRHGMLVTAFGVVNHTTRTGVASKVMFNSSLRGMVESIGADAQWLVVSGRRVNLNALTVLDQVTRTTFVVGKSVMVSGVQDSAGNWRASYIADDSFGTIQSADQPVADQPTVASDEVLKPLEQKIEAGTLVSLKGLITTVAGNQFTLQGLKVEHNASSRFENGVVADLAINADVAVTGVANAAGEIVASTISFTPARLARIDAQLERVTAASLTLAGVAVELNSSTLMLDSSVAKVRTFSVQNLAVGDNLVVYGFQTAKGILLTRLERFDSIAKQRISGPVTRVNQPVIEVLGLTIDTSTMTGTADLFTTLKPGDWVTATGSLNGAVLVADGVEKFP